MDGILLVLPIYRVRDVLGRWAGWIDQPGRDSLAASAEAGAAHLARTDRSHSSSTEDRHRVGGLDAEPDLVAADGPPP